MCSYRGFEGSRGGWLGWPAGYTAVFAPLTIQSIPSQNTNLAAEALQGTQAAYERVKQGQSEEQYARFAASLDDVNKSVVLQNSWQGGTANGEEGAGCRVLLSKCRCRLLCGRLHSAAGPPAYLALQPFTRAPLVVQPACGGKCAC
jgi:hypothetical protein